MHTDFSHSVQDIGGYHALTTADFGNSADSFYRRNRRYLTDSFSSLFINDLSHIVIVEGWFHGG